MSLTLTSSRGTTRSPSRGVRIAGTLLAVAGRLRRRAACHDRGRRRRRLRPRPSHRSQPPRSPELEQRIAADPDDGAAWQRLAPYYLAVPPAAAIAPWSSRPSKPSTRRSGCAPTTWPRIAPTARSSSRCTSSRRLTRSAAAPRRASRFARRAGDPRRRVDRARPLRRSRDAPACAARPPDRTRPRWPACRTCARSAATSTAPGVAMSQAETAAFGEHPRRRRSPRWSATSRSPPANPKRRSPPTSAPRRREPGALADRARAWRGRSPRSIAPTRRSRSSRPRSPASRSRR